MPRIVDYPQVIEHATARLGFASAYFNSGAFTYPRDAAIEIVGWVGPDDPSIRVELQPALVRAPRPYEASLSRALTSAWLDHLSGDAWVMPKAHWSFELDHGNGGWLPEALRDAGVDPVSLHGLTSAAAVAFAPGEAEAFESLAQRLLKHLVTSDFAVLFPDYRHLVTLHHHKQVWWQTPDAQLARTLRSTPLD